MDELLSHILAKRNEVPIEQSLLVGISGVDASGKGFITAKLAKEIEEIGFRVAKINADGWLNLPHIRFNQTNPAQNFYENAIRFLFCSDPIRFTSGPFPKKERQAKSRRSQDGQRGLG